MVNTIAIIGHSGSGRPIVAALAKSGAKIKVLHREGSNISGLDPSIEIIKIDYDDEASLTSALQGVDIFISFLGRDGVPLQNKFIEPFKAAGVKLFLPSDLGYRCSDDEAKPLPWIWYKHETVQALKENNIPYTRIFVGTFAEWMNLSFTGIDSEKNEVDIWGDGTASLPVTSVDYIASGFVKLFATTPPEAYHGRTEISFAEMQITGADVIETLTKKNNGVAPKVTYHSVDEIKATWEEEQTKETSGLDPMMRGVPLLRQLFHLKWAQGTVGPVGELVDLEGYCRKSLIDII